jgi:hypothetical protein
MLRRVLMRMRRRRGTLLRMGMASLCTLMNMPEDCQTLFVMMLMGRRVCSLRETWMGMGVASASMRMPERAKARHSCRDEEKKRKPSAKEHLLPAAPPHMHLFNSSSDSSARPKP